LPSYKAGLIFQYPKKDKNPQNFEITDLVTSLCFPFGLKICFGKYSDKKNDVIRPKKPHDFYFITTNGYNDQNFVYVYNFYVKMKIEDFKKNYKCDPVVNYLNILIKNNDKNFQEKFAECQNMISSQYVYIPHVCCLVSKYPYFKQMKQSIYSILNIRNNEEELIKFLKHIIYEIPDINKYQEYDLQLNFFTPHNMLPIVLKSNNYNRGLNIDLKYMGIILEYFQISLLIKIFKFMLTSQKLLFVVNDSSEYKILSLVTLALLNILYPFNWKYTYIPLLSFSMLKFLQSFLPFIMGIDNNMLEYSKNNYIDKQSNIIIIVLKKNKKSFIQEENPDENADIEIPTKLKDMLINNLKIISKKSVKKNQKEENILSRFTLFGHKEIKMNEDIGRELREVFLQFFIEIFGDYQEYTSSIDETAFFNSESFLNNVPKEYHNFYMTIFGSEMFHDFLQRNVVINSNLYEPDEYFNKFCIRQKKGNKFMNSNQKKENVFSKRKKHSSKKHKLPDKKDLELKEDERIKSKNSLIASDEKSKLSQTLTPATVTKFEMKHKKSGDINFIENSSKRKLSVYSNDKSDKNSEEESASESLNSSFNEETRKKCAFNNISNKFIVPPCFMPLPSQDLNLENIKTLIMDYYGENGLIKIKEYENNYIFENLPIINYDSKDSKGNKAMLLNVIKRYSLPDFIVEDFLQPKMGRMSTIYKSIGKENRFDPKIIQLEDFMKEILSSSGKNATNILNPKGNQPEPKAPQKDPEPSRDLVFDDEPTANNNNLKQNSNNLSSLDYLSILDFKNIILRKHFAMIMFQNRVNAYQSNIISSNTYSILSKMIFNVFLYSGNKSTEDFRVCRALTKSLNFYYKLNNKGKKIYLFNSFNKAKPFDIWTDKSFWQFFFERELDVYPEKDDNTKFNILIEIGSIMNDLHFSANTQVGIINDYIAKKELSDPELQNTLLQTIVKQCNNRKVVSASLD
jgi:hypothetical protein